MTVGLEIRGGEARIAVMERGAVRAMRSVPLEALPGALREMGAARQDCFLAWGEGATHQILSAPALGRAEQLGYLRRRALLPDDAELEEMGPARIGEHAGVELLAVSLAPAQLAEILRLARSLPVRLRLATSVPLGLARVEALLPKQPLPTAIASLFRDHATVVVVENGRLRLVREFNPALLGEAGDALAQEIARTVRHFAQSQPVGRAVLAGEQELIDRGLAPLRQSIACPVKQLSEILAIAANRYAVPVGLSLGDRGPRVPNLLPPRLRFRRERRSITAAAVALALAGLAAAWQSRPQALVAAQSAEEKVAKLEVLRRSRLEQLSSAQALERNLAWAARWRAVFDRFAESHDRWAQMAVGLANAAPPAVVFDRLEALRRGESCTVAVDLRSADETSVRDFASQVGGLPHVKQVTIASLRGRAGPRIEFELENSSPFADSSLSPASRGR